MITREYELKKILNEESVDIAFITETDTKLLTKEENYQISGYKTIFPNRISESSKIRIIALVKENITGQIKIRRDLMSNTFPSIWLELNNQIQKNTLIAGFYRQWSSETCNKAEAELQGMDIFTDQIELAFKEAKNTIIMGDANLCANKWKDENFTHKNMSNLLRGTLESCGMKIGQVGPTFMADHCQRCGMIAESWLD